MTGFLLVRHGETEWNRVERFRGRADVPLNSRGLSQAEATAQAIAARYRVDAVYSSPLSRAMKTAETIAARFSLSVHPCPGLIDIDYGRWQGLNPEQVRAEWPEQAAAWYDSPHMARIPGGESLDDLRKRCVLTVSDLASRHEGQKVVLVAHTVINRMILLAVLGLGNDRFWRLCQDTCAVNEFKADGGEYTLVSMNDTCHLQNQR